MGNSLKITREYYQTFQYKSWHIYKFAVKVGIASVLAGGITNGLKQLLWPIGYWRFPVSGVIDQVVKAGAPTNATILDIGSPKLLSVYLAAQLGADVHATDIQDPKIFSRYEPAYRNYKTFFGGLGSYHVAFQDARQLEYDSDAFDVVYSVSVIEHIPAEGDSEAMKEISRVLKPGGKAIVEVPYAKESYDTYLNGSVYEREYTGQPLFYQRHYDDESLQARLIVPSGLTLLRKISFIERKPFELLWSNVPVACKWPFLWAEPIISSINHVEFEGFQENKTDVKTRCGADVILVLEKPE